MENHYETLGVNENDTHETIKKKYRKLSLKYHPDKPTGDVEMFKKITGAYEVVGDEDKRKEYDMKRKNPFANMGMGRGGGRGGGMRHQDINEMFSNLFNMHHMDIPMSGMGIPGLNIPGLNRTRGMGGMPNIRIFTNGQEVKFNRKPDLITKNITITLKEAYLGKKIPVDIQRWVVSNNTKTNEMETIYVNLIEGIDENEVIMIKERGNVFENMKGDIKVVVKIKNDTNYVRKGLDLIYTKELTLKETLVGFKFDLLHLSGKSYNINNSDGLIVKHDTKYPIEKLGFKRDGSIGNLIIQFSIKYPDKLTKEQITKLKEIL